MFITSYVSGQLMTKNTLRNITAQKIKFSIQDFFSKCDQIHKFLQIQSHLQKKSLMENFIFCAVYKPSTLIRESKHLNNHILIMDVAECFSLLNNSMEKKLRKGHLRQSLFFNNVLTDFIAGLSKKETFSCEFCEIFKNTFFTEYLWTSFTELLLSNAELAHSMPLVSFYTI